MSNSEGPTSTRFQVGLAIFATVIAVLAGIFGLIKTEPNIVINLADLATPTPNVIERTVVVTAEPIAAVQPEVIEVTKIVTVVVTQEVVVTREVEVTRIVQAESTPYPTYTPHPTYTLPPTHTPWPTHTSHPTATPKVVVVTATSTPPVIDSAGNTVPGAVLATGETWKEDGVELTFDVTFTSNPTFPIYMYWEGKNLTGQQIQMPTLEDWNKIKVEDNFGREIEIFGVPGCRYVDEMLDPGGTSGNSEGCPLRLKIDIDNSSLTELLVTVSDYARIEEAQWRISLDAVR